MTNSVENHNQFCFETRLTTVFRSPLKEIPLRRGFKSMNLRQSHHDF